MTLSWDENQINPLSSQNCRLKLKQFSEKWREVLESFEGKFIDNGYLLVSDETFSIDVSTNDASNFDKSVFQFFSNVTEITGIEAYQMFSFGVSPLPENFYKELFEILALGRTDENNASPAEYFKLFSVTANVDNVEGQYSGSFNLRKDGTFLAAFDLYDEDSLW